MRPPVKDVDAWADWLCRVYEQGSAHGADCPEEALRWAMAQGLVVQEVAFNASRDQIAETGTRPIEYDNLGAECPTWFYYRPARVRGTA